jgi:hypothetical protein
MISSVIFYILILCQIKAIVTIFVNVPGTTFKTFMLWRLFTTVLVMPSILNILFGFLAWVPNAIQLEREQGTVKYLLSFFINTFVIQLLFCLFIFLLSFISAQLLQTPSYGLWPLIMFEITVTCAANPERQMMFFFLPCPMKAKYYPWVLFFFFTLLSGFMIQFDLVSGILYGYLYHFKLQKFLSLSDGFIKKVEGSFLFKCCFSFSGFVPFSGASGFGLSGSVGTNDIENNNAGASTNFSTGNNNREEPKQHPVTTPFRGKGSVVGGGVQATNPPNVPWLSNTNQLEINENAEHLSVSNTNQQKNKTKQDNKYQALNEDGNN